MVLRSILKRPRKLSANILLNEEARRQGRGNIINIHNEDFGWVIYVQGNPDMKGILRTWNAKKYIYKIANSIQLKSDRVCCCCSCQTAVRISTAFIRSILSRPLGGCTCRKFRNIGAWGLPGLTRDERIGGQFDRVGSVLLGKAVVDLGAWDGEGWSWTGGHVRLPGIAICRVHGQERWTLIWRLWRYARTVR